MLQQSKQTQARVNRIKNKFKKKKKKEQICFYFCQTIFCEWNISTTAQCVYASSSTDYIVITLATH